MINLSETVPNSVKLDVGDVLMVAMELNDKHKEGRKFWWRFFGVVTKAFKHNRFAEVLVLDDKQREPMQISFYKENTIVRLLTPEEWPDGVHAFRTKAILDGKVDAIF